MSVKTKKTKPSKQIQGQNILIAAGGFQKKSPPAKKWDLIIGADSGADFLYKHDIPAHIIIGDLDSISDQAMAFHTENGAEIRQFPIDKDATDLELTLKELPTERKNKIYLTGLFGGRWDHEIMNILSLSAWTNRGTYLFDFNGGCGGVIGPGLIKIYGLTPGTTASLIALTTKAQGIFSQGVKWELIGETLHLGESRGISNLIKNSPWEIRLCKGVLLWIIFGLTHEEIETEWHPAPV